MDQAEVVVVGAGILGNAVAFHLLECGVSDVVVLEAGTAASGTSGAGGGIAALWAAGFNDVLTEADLQLEEYGMDFYGRLARDHDDLGYRHNGTLFVATTDAAWNNWIARIVQHPLAPRDVRTLDAKETSDATGGVLSADAVVGGVLIPRGVQFSAGRATRALSERVTAMGGVIRTQSRVTRLLKSGDKVTGVETEVGKLRASQVVLACGAWTNELLADVGLHIPLVRMVGTRAITAPSDVSSSMPAVMVPELSGLWLREHRGGFTYGNHDGYAPMFALGGSVGDPGQPRRHELVTRLEAALSPQLQRLVPDHDTSIAWWVQGMPCYTPDRRHVVGPIPGLDGLHVLAGDCEAGVTHGPGLGRLVAETCVTGSSDWLDTSDYCPSRFDLETYQSDEEVYRKMPPRTMQY